MMALIRREASMLIPARSACGHAAQPPAHRICGAAHAAQDRGGILSDMAFPPNRCGFCCALVCWLDPGILQQGSALGYPASRSAATLPQRELAGVSRLLPVRRSLRA